nr:MAG TPA_asm: hypothetical protein [Caudoviricetes sp.]
MRTLAGEIMMIYSTFKHFTHDNIFFQNRYTLLTLLAKQFDMIILIIFALKIVPYSQRHIKMNVFSCLVGIMGMMDIVVIHTLKISILLTIQNNAHHTYLLISISPSYRTIPPCTRLV